MLSPETPPVLARNLRFASLLVAVAVGTAFLISIRTAYNVHPDEFVHVDAFCYYETHWWPPSLDSDGLAYNSYGWSWVYDGELVYLIYGRLGGLVQSVFPAGFTAAGCIYCTETLTEHKPAGFREMARNHTGKDRPNILPALFALTLGSRHPIRHA